MAGRQDSRPRPGSRLLRLRVQVAAAARARLGCGLVLCALLSACAGRPSIGVDRQVLIDAGDTRLFAEIRGKDRDAPVLLYLHGGPGSPLGVALLRAYGGPLLEERFNVAYLHQRGIMRSPRVPDEAHRVDLYVRDVDHVVRFLHGEFPNRDVFILGHSWGGTLAFLYLAEHPHQVSRLVAVAAPVDVKTMVRARVAMTLRWAEEAREAAAIRDLTPLEGLDPVDDADKFEVLGKWSSRAYGGWSRNVSQARVDAAVDFGRSIPEWLEDKKHVEALLLAEILRIDLRDELAALDIPVLCIVGRDDVDVPWYVVQEGMRGYGGPLRLEIFQRSHHMPFIDEEARFAETVIGFLEDR